MNMMRHCRQCRADAVGLLGEDRGAEFTLDKIDAMEIDYEAAMERRAKVHADIAEELAQRRQHGPAAVPILQASSPAVLMAVATKGGGLVNEHFGHAREFLIYEASAEGVRFIGHRRVETPYCEGDSSCGEGESALAKIIGALDGCRAVLCAKVGYEPWSALENAGIQPNGEHAMEPIEEAVLALYQELLEAGKLADDVTRQRQSA